MSQYPPPNGYGHHRGQPPPQQQHSYELPQNYDPTTYNTSHNLGIIDLTSAPGQNAFNYHANRIPGLGIGGGADDKPAENTTAHAWIARNGFGDILQTMSQTVAVPAAGDSSGDSAGHGTSNHSQRPAGPPKPITLAAHAPLNSDIEEGELSEGQFEDLYEPVESVEPTVNVRELPKALAAINDSGVVSAADTPETAFYGNDEEEAGANTTKKGDTAVNRERSGSYSPFLSPGESPNDDPSSPEVVDISEDLRPGATYPAQQNSDKGKQAVPGLKFAPQNPQTESANARSAQDTMPPDQDEPSFKSLEEARKEAQKAILRLWHLGVRYQQYIDEGFDEKIVKSLFTHLNLDLQDSQSNQQDKSSASNTGQPAQQREAPKMASSVLSKDQGAVSGQAKKGEERKDRIARLLAAKAAKPPAPSRQTPPPTQPQTDKVPEKKIAPPTAPAAMSRSKTWGEKEILLQQKIAALQEAQARKAANGKPRPVLTQTQPQMAGKGNNVSGQTLPEAVPTPSSVALKTGAGSDQPPKDSEISQPVPKSVPSIPGLLLSSIPTGPARNQRKRPVASDFVDQPSSTTRSHKRPFGQNRNETSFVIDVSDGSDDEEMDMDMESPLEDSASFPTAGMPSQRGPSIRDFPPLTDICPPRQFSSPVPSSNTPLGHPILSKKRETELDIKEKEIQEMRRKIAEAEARRKAKQYSGGSQTPDQAGQTPDSKDNEPTSGSDPADGRILQPSASPKLPKKPEASHRQQHKVERRGRAVTQMDGALEEKMNRLKKLREEEMRLEAEINNQLARKKLMSEELENLGESSSDDNTQLNGLSSSDPSGMAHLYTPRPCFLCHLTNLDIFQVVPSPKPDNTSAVDNDFEQNEGAGDISMDESSVQSSPVQTPLERVPYGQPSPGGITTDSGTKAPDAHQPLLGAVIETPSLEGSRVEPSLTSAATVASADAVFPTEVDQHADSLGSDDPAPMEIESPSPSLSANPTSHDIADDQVSPLRESPVVSLDQISNLVPPRQEVQEIETGDAREVHVVSPTRGRHTSLTFCQDNAQSKVQPNVQHKQQSEPSALPPYNSPLRYFHAYRFHPSYSETVGGGLKSLTYSNRINPEKPFCPSELSGKQCPANCEFQHFRSIATPSQSPRDHKWAANNRAPSPALAHTLTSAVSLADDQILLELGKADEYSGEQKSRFIQGLRKLLQDIREQEHQDFDSIAREIIKFRARFLGDESKVLPLEGVTL